MKKLAKTAAIIFIITLGGKFLGFFREIVLAYKFGTSFIVDAYTVAVTLPSVIFSIGISGFSQSYIPIITRIKDDEEKRRFYNSVQSIFLLISFAIAVLCIFASRGIAKVLAPGFEAEAFELTVLMIKSISVIFPIMTAFNFVSANMHAHEEFVFFSFCNNIVIDVIIISSIAVANKNHILILTCGYVLSQGIALVMTWIYSEKIGIQKFRFNIDFSNENLGELCLLGIPLGLSLFANQINSVVDRVLASSIGEGIISGLNYANKLQLIIMSLTTTIFATVCYPRINMYFSENRYDDGMYYVRKGCGLACFIGIPITAFLFFFSTPVVRILFERGNFNADSTEITAGCLAFYALGIIFYGLREIASRALAADKKQKLIMKNTLLSVAFNIAFNLLMIRFWSYIGLALATSLSGFLTFILMYYDLKKLGLKLLDKENWKDIFKITLITLILVISMYPIYSFSSIYLDDIFGFLVATVIEGFVYIFLCKILKVSVWLWMKQNTIGIKRGDSNSYTAEK